MGAPNSSFQQKVDWMVQHEHYWRHWPTSAFTDDEIKGLMRRDGLISDKANNYDIMDFGKLVMAAREQLRKDRHARKT